MHFHVPISSKALPDYLVRNMGFISLKISRDSVVIRGTPALISYAAFSVGLELIEDAAPRRLALSWLTAAGTTKPISATISPAQNSNCSI
jgi:hypothetical protein